MESVTNCWGPWAESCTESRTGLSNGALGTITTTLTIRWTGVLAQHPTCDLALHEICLELQHIVLFFKEEGKIDAGSMNCILLPFWT